MPSNTPPHSSAETTPCPAPEQDLTRYPSLVSLVTDEFKDSLGPIANKSFKAGLDAAFRLPEGQDRETLLSCLNSGVRHLLRVRTLMAEKEALRLALEQAKPDLSELMQTATMLRQGTRTLQLKFRSAYEKSSALEKAASVRVLGHMDWFEHELAVFADTEKFVLERWVTHARQRAEQVATDGMTDEAAE